MRFAQLRQCIVLSMALCAAGTTIHAQQAVNQPPTAPQAAQPERFEVASIRPSHPDPEHIAVNRPGSAYFRDHHVPLTVVIAQAYLVDSSHIKALEWMTDQCYDIDAKAEGDAPRSNEQFAPMLRQMLEEHLHMKAHRVTHEQSGYALVAAKTGAKLQPADEKSTSGKGIFILKDRLSMPSASLQTLASLLAHMLDAPIVDRTSIAGNYVFDLSFAPINDENSTKPSLVTALEEQFGLKLVPEKNIPIDELVVDSADRTPTEN